MNENGNPAGKLLSKGKPVEDVDLVFEEIKVHAPHENTGIEFFSLADIPDESEEPGYEPHFHPETMTTEKKLTMKPQMTESMDLQVAHVEESTITRDGHVHDPETIAEAIDFRTPGDIEDEKNHVVRMKIPMS